MEYGVITGYGIIEFENELREYVEQDWMPIGQMNTNVINGELVFSVMISRLSKPTQ